jgi:hypothetical protein
VSAPRGPVALAGFPGYWCDALDDDLVDRLVRRTHDPRDPLLRAFTRDAERFADPDAVTRWRVDRSIVCLLDERGELMGISWLSPRPLPPGYDWSAARVPLPPRAPSCAIRLYGEARGKGISWAFAVQALRSLVQQPSAPPALWYECRRENVPVRRMTARLGFRELTAAGPRIVGGRPVRLPLPAPVAHAVDAA